jgi:purine-binding chemotaxis protein CheW
VTAIAPEQLREPPEAIARATTHFIRAVAQIGDRLLMLVDSGQVAGEKAASAEAAGDEATHGQ